MKQKSNQTEKISRREEIIQIATKLFAEEGYHVATLDDVAKQLDVTRASLYYHIDSKESVLKEICDKVMKARIKDTRIILRSKLSPTEKLRLHIREQVKDATEGKEVSAVLFEQSDALSTRARKTLRSQMRTFDQMMVEMLQEGTEQGCFEIDDVRMASFAILGAIFWAYRWYDHNGRLTPDEIAGAFIKLLENGYLKRSAERQPIEQCANAKQPAKRSSKRRALAKAR
jgi:AcrR family transcriptional regulator